ncbi:MAG: PDZ domain-containing protein [Planctomycetaceae bacterium]
MSAPEALGFRSSSSACYPVGVACNLSPGTIAAMLMAWRMIIGLLLLVAGRVALADTSAEWRVLLRQLSAADQATATQAERQIAATCSPDAINRVVDLARQGEAEAASRAVRILSGWVRTSELPLADAAEQGLESLSQNASPAVAGAAEQQLVLLRDLREQRAIAVLRKLGAKVDIGPDMGALAARLEVEHGGSRVTQWQIQSLAEQVAALAPVILAQELAGTPHPEDAAEPPKDNGAGPLPPTGTDAAATEVIPDDAEPESTLDDELGLDDPQASPPPVVEITAADVPYGVTNVFLTSRWRGTNDDLWHLRRLRHSPKPWELYLVEGTPADKLAVLEVTADLDNVRLQERGPSLGVSGKHGPWDDHCVIQNVLPGGAADRAGIQEGDIVLSIGQRRISDFSQLISAVGELSEGEKVDVAIIRRGTPLQLQVEMVAWDDVDTATALWEKPIPESAMMGGVPMFMMPAIPRGK